MTLKDAYDKTVPVDHALIKAHAKTLFEERGFMAASWYIAEAVYAGYKNPHDGEPYIRHLERVSKNLSDSRLKGLAFLHDLIEMFPKDWSFQDLLDIGYTQDDIDILDSVTRREGEKYYDFNVRNGYHPRGAKLKKADFKDNTDLTRIPRDKFKDLVFRHHKDKYVLGYHYMCDVDDGKIARGTPIAIWAATQPEALQDWDLIAEFSAADHIELPLETIARPASFIQKTICFIKGSQSPRLS